MKSNWFFLKVCWYVILYILAHAFCFALCSENEDHRGVPGRHVQFDVTVLGPVCFADGIGRQAIGFTDCLKDVACINFIHTRGEDQLDVRDIPDAVKAIIQNTSWGSSNFAILEDVLSNGNVESPEYYYKKIPTNNLISYAYTMFESTRIPDEWVGILNNNFDAALVPDQCLVNVYKNSGVHIPIFVLPLGIYIEQLLEVPLKEKANTPFVFGFSGAFTDRKNHEMVLEAFAAVFKNSPRVRLKLHGRSGSELSAKLQHRIAQLGLTNVEVICKSFTQDEYNAFMQSLTSV